MEKLFKAIELIKSTLPSTIDLTEDGKWVKKADFGTKEYITSSECVLSIQIEIGSLNISGLYYYSEDDELYYFGESLDFEKMTKNELIAAFSEEFGWIENFEDENKELD